MMLVRGSTATASWLKRPMSMMGRGSTGPVALESTSKTQPWVLVKLVEPPSSSFGPTAVSSQLSQLPHGVGPPAQLTVVPERLTKSDWSSRFAPTTSVVVPPPATGSYGLAPRAEPTLPPFRSS